MDIENIPYYNFSLFPVSNDLLLEIINSAVKKKIKKIIINFGNTFPWSYTGSEVPEFVFSEKVIDKIVTICRHHEIILIPVLSVLKESDYIICNKNFQYLTTVRNGRSILDPSAAGAAKFIEELMEDIFSLFIYSDYLLLELPGADSDIPDLKNDLSVLLDRLVKNSEIESRHLLFTERDSCYKEEKINNFSGSTAALFKGCSYSLFLCSEQLTIEKTACRVFSLRSFPHFPALSDPADYLEIINGSDSLLAETQSDLNLLDSFFTHLDKIWLLIREGKEYLSLLYSGANYVNRIKFVRSVNLLLREYSEMLKKSRTITEKYKKKYQPGVIERWFTGRINPVSLQINDLETISGQISREL